MSTSIYIVFYILWVNGDYFNQGLTRLGMKKVENYRNYYFPERRLGDEINHSWILLSDK
jgi:hypothetical protein